MSKRWRHAANAAPSQSFALGSFTGEPVRSPAWTWWIAAPFSQGLVLGAAVEADGCWIGIVVIVIGCSFVLGCWLVKITFKLNGVGWSLWGLWFFDPSQSDATVLGDECESLLRSCCVVVHWRDSSIGLLLVFGLFIESIFLLRIDEASSKRLSACRCAARCSGCVTR